MNSSLLSSLSSRFFATGKNSQPSGVEEPSATSWRRIYWLYAAIIPLTLYAFDATRIIFYHIARSPNVGLAAQLSLTFLFYGLWILVPRLIWPLAVQAVSRASRWGKKLIPIAGFGLALAVFHLLVLTYSRLIMYSRAAFQWEPIHILHIYGGVWLRFGGIWILAYMIYAAAIFYILTRTHPKPPPPARYEVRENGKTLSIPLEEIYWIKAAGNYVELHTTRGVTMVRKTLNQISQELSGGEFLKSHRSALINGRHVVAIKPREDTTGYSVQLSNETEAPLSRRRLKAFKDLLKAVK
ncbi:MAG: hypothetical protein DHS20C05_20560 [Hyphococcus sp.]|nr:MAG: hypothetical protein DHS20C05_20560 [Marinicaulis sp.]